MDTQITRLKPGERHTARKLFIAMAEVFEETCEDLSDTWIDHLLAREDFWAIAAFADDQIIGGITAHTLPMTRAASSELFIYDVAVRAGYQRKGVGRLLIAHLRRIAAASGIPVLFVAAENQDSHALDFYRALGGAPAQVTMFTFEHQAFSMDP